MSKITKTKNPVTQDERQSFAFSLSALAGHIERIANELVGLIERDPETISKLVSEFPQIQRRVLVRLEQVGRKKMHWRGFFECSSAVNAVSKLPYDTQEKIFNGASIPVVEEESPGKLKTVLKKYNEITNPSSVRD